MTNMRLEHDELIPNRVLRSALRMHPYDIHIKIEYEYGYPYLHFKRIRIRIIRMFGYPDPSLGPGTDTRWW